MPKVLVEIPTEVERRIVQRMPERPIEQAIVTLLKQALESDRITENHQRFLESPLGEYIRSSALSDMTLEEVLEITSRFKGVWSEEIIAAREDRV
ncbi:MAG: hypothetical protein DRI61_02600 [Chloroflexi bacterium]|nr:MAG: hypothetical protein DRI61_02600 [Chloroflexota bacterium]